jgi:hypothetical protein
MNHRSSILLDVIIIPLPNYLYNGKEFYSLSWSGDKP